MAISSFFDSGHLVESDVDAHSPEDLLVGEGPVGAGDVALGGVPAGAEDAH